jgi:hypothetical protein
MIGDYAKARDMFESAAQAGSNPREKAYVLFNLGMVHQQVFVFGTGEIISLYF